MPIYESVGFGNDLHLFDKKRAFDYVAERRPMRVPQGTNIDDFKRNSAPYCITGLVKPDENGNYKYPEGFDPEANEWLEGFDAQREAWEAQYAEAQARFEAHKVQVAKALEADAEAAAAAPAAAEPAPTSYSSEEPASAGTLASDEALAELRKKLTGN